MGGGLGKVDRVLYSGVWMGDNSADGWCRSKVFVFFGGGAWLRHDWLGTVMNYHKTLKHVKYNFGPIQYGPCRADFGLCQDGPFHRQISVLTNATYIVYSGPLMHIASFWNFNPRWAPSSTLPVPLTGTWNFSPRWLPSGKLHLGTIPQPVLRHEWTDFFHDLW